MAKRPEAADPGTAYLVPARPPGREQVVLLVVDITADHRESAMAQTRCNAMTSTPALKARVANVCRNLFG